MTIIHDIYGEVEGASNYSVADRPSSMGKHFMGEKGTWHKNGAIYLDSNGWREKVVELWEEDSGYLKEAEARGCLSFLTTQRLTPDKRWAVVERYELPDDFANQYWDHSKLSIANYFAQFKKPCLIIERKVEP